MMKIIRFIILSIRIYRMFTPAQKRQTGVEIATIKATLRLSHAAIYKRPAKK